jgi:hypothetical protein
VTAEHGDIDHGDAYDELSAVGGRSADDDRLADDPLGADEVGIDLDDAELDLLSAEDDLEVLGEDQFDAWPGDLPSDTPGAPDIDETIESLIRRPLGGE